MKFDYCFLYFSSNKYKRLIYADAYFVQQQKKYRMKKKDKKNIERQRPRKKEKLWCWDRL